MIESKKQAVVCRKHLHQQEVLICATEFSRYVSSAALLGDGDTLAIQHSGECYILRQTRAGKLILTK